MRIRAAAGLMCLLVIAAGCGGGASPSQSSGGPLSGNWQVVLAEEFPKPPTQLSVSGFLMQSKDSLTGSVVLPGRIRTGKCAGVGPVTGTISGQSVTLSIDEGGSTMSLTGSISSDNKSMTGAYAALGGGCSAGPTSGTWTAFQIPPLNGSFTGTLSNANSVYMALATGMTPPPPIAVSGSLSQSPNSGASNATLTGTITAVSYPCFVSASFNGTISGSNVVLSIFAFEGSQIGTLGIAGNPATVSAGPGGLSLEGGNGIVDPSALSLGLATPGGSQGPCPGLFDPGSNITLKNDQQNVTLTFQ